MARAVRDDGGEAAPGARYLNDHDRLEEYSASHSESYDELGNWPADRFESAWEAYQLREGFDSIAKWERGMVEALHANGMIGGDDFSKQLDSIRAHAEALRASLSGSDLEEVEGELASEAPYPVTAEANPDGT